MATNDTTTAPDAGRRKRPTIRVAWDSRIPVARINEGPAGLSWFVEAVLSSAEGTPHVPALLLRPCWHPAFVPEALDRLRGGLTVGGLEDCLLRPSRPEVREPVPLPHTDGRADVAVDPYPLLDLVDREFGPEDRRRVLDTAPWTLLADEHPALLGLDELIGMDHVDAAYAATLQIRLARQVAGRGPDRALPTPAVSLVGALVSRGQTVAAASGLVAELTGASIQGLADAHRAAVRARRRGPRPVVVVDPAPEDVTDLRNWVRTPRVVRMVCVLAAGRVGAVEALLSRDGTVGGWLARRSLPLLQAAVVGIRGTTEPPASVVATNIVMEGDHQCYEVWGLARDKAALVLWFEEE